MYFGKATNNWVESKKRGFPWGGVGARGKLLPLRNGKSLLGGKKS